LPKTLFFRSKVLNKIFLTILGLTPTALYSSILPRRQAGGGGWLHKIKKIGQYILQKSTKNGLETIFVHS
jgi:hypothetical protein